MRKVKPKLHFYRVYDLMFRAHLNLYVGDWDLFVKEMRSLKLDACNSEEMAKPVQGLFIKEGLYSIMFLKEKDRPTIVHELTHYALVTLFSHGIDMENQLNEPMAYYMEMMFVEISKKLWPKESAR